MDRPVPIDPSPPPGPGPGPGAARWPDATRFVVPLVAAVIAMGGRALLGPWLNDSVPFVFALPAVAALAVRFGPGTAATCALLCTVWALLPWMPPSIERPLAPWAFLASAAALAWGLPWLVGAARARAPAQPVDESGVHHRVVDMLHWILLLSALLPALVFGGVAAWQLHLRERETDLRLERAVRAAAEHAARVYETHEMLLRRVVDRLGNDDDARLRAREPALHAQLREMTAELPQVQSVWVHDAAGRPVISSRALPAPRELDVSDREFFRWHRDHRGGPFVTEALVGRGTGEPYAGLSLRRDGPDGRFAGVVSVGLHLSVFGDFQAELAKDLPGATLGLVRADGRWISRTPGTVPVEAALRADDPVRAAMAEHRSAGRLGPVRGDDGAGRQIAFRQVAGLPVWVVAERSRADLLAAWHGDVALLAAIVLPLGLGAVGLSRIALRRAEQGLGAVERLQAESAQRLRAEAALRQSQKLEALGRLTGGVAHDFNNLLTVVHTNAHLIRRLAGDAPVAPQLAAIERAVRGGAQLTRRLLAFARRQVVQAEPISLQARMPELAVLIRPLLPPGIELEVEVAPGTEGIEVDRAELELAILNLVSNARDAMPDGGRLRVSARNADPAEDGTGRVLVEVADTGVGVPPELAERVFEPFFSTKPRGEGTGLGLAQVRELCRTAGGTARLSSVPGAGTTVSLLFPAVTLRPDASPPEAAAPPPSLALRVLLVEDNPDVAAATGELLESMGCSVRRVPDASAALAALEAGTPDPDVVLSDIAMPGRLDGVALGAWLRVHRPRVGVVLMTGYAERLGPATEQGRIVLLKPCAPAALARALWAAHRETVAAQGAAG